MTPGNSDFTRTKWHRLAQLLDVHLKMVRGVFLGDRDHRALPTYIYVDLYSGPGLYLPSHSTDLAGSIGSPLIALRRLKAAKREAGMDFTAYFADADEGTCDELRTSLIRDGHDDQVHRVSKACCALSVDRLIQWRTSRNKYGIIFVDPNGYPDWDALRLLAMSPQWYCVDILVNLNATVHKRCLKSSRNSESLRPTDHLKAINKKYISLWTPPSNSNPHQFTLAYLTNWTFLEFRKQGFHGINSAKGQAISRLIDYTDDERKALPPIAGLLPGADWDRAILDRDAGLAPEGEGDIGASDKEVA